MNFRRFLAGFASILVVALWASSAFAIPAEDQPPGVKAPHGTIPYSAKTCHTNSNEPAFSFVKIHARFDKNGCTRPVRAWVQDVGNHHWLKVNPKIVLCCDPAAEAGMSAD